jgi:transposase
MVDLTQRLAQVMCLSDVAGFTGLDWDRVKDVVKERLEEDYARPNLKELVYLSIDEIYVGRAKKFYTIVIDLDSGRIVWVSKGRSGESLKKFWRALRKSKAKIKAVCCDLSAAYWKAIRDNLPKAAVVFDRFHLVKLMNEKLDELRRSMQREADEKLRKSVKGVRWLLLMRADKVGEEKLPRLQEALAHNTPLLTGYLLKEMLGLLWAQLRKEKMEEFLREWCLLAAGTGVKVLQTMAKTLASHASGILSWWEHPISNGRMEGINNKIKAMLRQHYGLRDERFFILRLLSLHEIKLKLSGC